MSKDVIIKENLINRKTYKRVKKMDRNEMEHFLEGVYRNAFRDGADSGSNVDMKIELFQFLENLDVKGIGPVTKSKILQEFKSWEGVENVK